MNRIISFILFIFCINSIVSAQTASSHSTDSINSMLKEVLYWDQKVRADYDKNQDKSKEKELLNQWTLRDSLNQSLTFPVIDSIIAGNVKDLSYDSWRTCFFVLQHAPNREQVKYIDFVYEYFKKGYIQNYEYMIFCDRINVQQNRAQPFGSQVAKLPYGYYVVFPFESKKKRENNFTKIGVNINDVKVENGTLHMTTSIKCESFPSSMLVQNTDSDVNKSSATLLKPTIPQYGPLELESDEFGIMMLVKQDKAGFDGVTSGIEIVANKKKQGYTNKDGVLLFKVKKNRIPKKINVIYPGGKKQETNLKPIVVGQDYVIQGI